MHRFRTTGGMYYCNWKKEEGNIGPHTDRTIFNVIFYGRKTDQMWISFVDILM